MFPGNEVRLMNAYFVTCTGCEKDENGNVTVIHATYDEETRGVTSLEEKWRNNSLGICNRRQSGEVRLYENIVDEEKGVYNEEDGSINVNPHSLTVLRTAM